MNFKSSKYRKVSLTILKIVKIHLYFRFENSIDTNWKMCHEIKSKKIVIRPQLMGRNWNSNEEGLVMMFFIHTSKSDDPSESLYVWRVYEDKE